MLFVICYLYYTILVRIQKLGFLVCVYGLLHLFRSQHCQSIGNDSNLLFADRYSVPHRCITFTGSARIRMLCSSWERGGGGLLLPALFGLFLKNLKIISFGLLFIVP